MYCTEDGDLNLSPSTGYRKDVEVNVTTQPGAEPVTDTELRTALKIRSDMRSDADLALILKAVRQRVEKITGLGLMQQTVQQMQNVVSKTYQLYRRNCLSIVSIQYIATDTDDTLVTVDPASYFLVGKYRVSNRTNWPSHRGLGSWFTHYKVGFYALPDAPTAEQFTLARNAVPEELRRAIMMWCGNIFENAEGQMDVSYLAQAAQGSIPPLVSQLLEAFKDRRLSIR